MCLLGKSMAIAGPNPIVMRLSNAEIFESKTPASVALNFVVSIYYGETGGMLCYMTPETQNEFEEQRKSDGYINYDPYFSVPGTKLNIKGWKSAIDAGGYEIAPTYVQDVGVDEYGRECKKVYVECVLSREMNKVGFQDITRYGNTNVKVLLVKTPQGWKVTGFK